MTEAGVLESTERASILLLCVYCVILSGKPDFLLKPENVTVVLGQNAAMSCMANPSTFPEVNTSWFFSRTLSSTREKISSEDMMDKGIAVSKSGHLLQMFSVETEREGYYHCTISNRQGSFYTSAYLRVTGRL